VTNLRRLSSQSEGLSIIKDVYATGRMENLFGLVSRYFSVNTTAEIINLILLILLFLLFLWLTIISQSAIINKVNQENKGREIDFKNSFAVGRKFFKPVFLINLFSRLIIYVLFLLICGPIFYLYLKSSSVSQVYVISYLILSFIIFVPIGIIVAFIAKYATAYVVIKEIKLWAAIKEGWSLFVKNWLISLEMAVLLFIINFFTFVAFIIVCVLLSIPFFILAAIFNSVASSVGTSLIGILGYLVFYLLLFLLGAVFAVFQYSSWTLLFIKLNEGTVLSKIVRMISPVKAKQ